MFGITFAAHAEQLSPYGLLINAQGYNQDLTWLKKKQSAKNRQWDITGIIQGEHFQGQDDQGKVESGTSFTQVGVNIGAYFHPWVTGVLSIQYDDEFAPEALTHLKRGSSLLDKAFITIGNLDQSPFYGSLGKRYVAFGQYNDFMVTRPLTRALGRIKAQQLSFSYYHPGNTGLYATAFTYNGYSTVRPRQQWGGTIGYEFEMHETQADIGVDYVTNIADSDGIVSAMGNIPTLIKRVPGIAIHTNFIKGPIDFSAEYIAATTAFHSDNIGFNNVGAKPEAAHTQLTYAFKTGEKQSNISVGYTQTRNALAFLMPKHRFAATYNLLILKNTILSFEYLHDKEYSENTIAELQGTTISSPGGYANTGTLQLAWFF